MQLLSNARNLGLAALAIGIGVSSLTAALPARPAQAAALASVSQQGDGSGAQASPLAQVSGRLSAIDGMVASGDCAAARSEIRSLLSSNPDSLFGSDVTVGQLRELRGQMNDTLQRAANRC